MTATVGDLAVEEALIPRKNLDADLKGIISAYRVWRGDQKKWRRSPLTARSFSRRSAPSTCAITQPLRRTTTGAVAVVTPVDGPRPSAKPRRSRRWARYPPSFRPARVRRFAESEDREISPNSPPEAGVSSFFANFIQNYGEFGHLCLAVGTVKAPRSCSGGI